MPTSSPGIGICVLCEIIKSGVKFDIENTYAIIHKVILKKSYQLHQSNVIVGTDNDSLFYVASSLYKTSMYCDPLNSLEFNAEIMITELEHKNQDYPGILEGWQLAVWWREQEGI